MPAISGNIARNINTFYLEIGSCVASGQRFKQAAVPGQESKSTRVRRNDDAWRTTAGTQKNIMPLVLERRLCYFLFKMLS
jgi:hypothetical protein